MSHQPDSIANLIYAFLTNNLTPEQELDLQQWLQDSPGNAAYFASVVEKFRSGELSKNFFELNEEKIWQKITDVRPELQVSPTKVIPLRSNRLRKIAMAAVVIAAAAIGIWFTIFNNKTDTPPTLADNIIIGDDVMPGGDKAVLILADGKKIILDTSGNGQILSQESVKIVQSEKGKLEYKTVAGNNKAAALLYNTIVVPAGGRFKVELPDGSLVWLNAQSSLKYPIAFDGAPRNVTLKGEAYFEVAKMINRNERVPFNVAVQSESGELVSTIEVKGTHFNISAYDTVLRTTLTEGKVKVISKSGASTFLSPGQQSIQEGATALTVTNNADTEQATAWVSGWFNFNNASIREVMDEAARWYNLKVEYQGNVTDNHFSFNLTRDIPISKLLQVIQMTGSLKFNINKNTNVITVQQ